MHFDRDFIKKLITGDKKSFEILFLDTYPSLCEYSISITRSKEASEGAVQDVFAALWQARKSLDDDVHIKAFLFRSVKNRSLDIVEHERIRIKYQKEISRIYNELSSTEDGSSSASELIRRVQKEIEKLPENSKVVYLLHRRDGLTYAEIAEVLGISVKAVEARMTKALKILRQRLAEETDLKLLPLLAILAI